MQQAARKLESERALLQANGVAAAIALAFAGKEGANTWQKFTGSLSED